LFPPSPIFETARRGAFRIFSFLSSSCRMSERDFHPFFYLRCPPLFLERFFSPSVFLALTYLDLRPESLVIFLEANPLLLTFLLLPPPPRSSSPFFPQWTFPWQPMCLRSLNQPYVLLSGGPQGLKTLFPSFPPSPAGVFSAPQSFAARPTTFSQWKRSQLNCSLVCDRRWCRYRGVAPTPLLPPPISSRYIPVTPEEVDSHNESVIGLSFFFPLFPPCSTGPPDPPPFSPRPPSPKGLHESLQLSLPLSRKVIFTFFLLSLSLLLSEPVFLWSPFGHPKCNVKCTQ